MRTKKFALCALALITHTTHASWAHETLEQLTLEQKIGQLFVVAALTDFESGKNDALMERTPYQMDKPFIEHLITTYHIGGIIFMGLGTAAQQHALTQHYQSLSRVPLLCVQDLEWGLGMRLHDCIKFPRNMTLAAIADKNLIYAFGKEVGKQMRQLGVHMNCAPVVDVNNNAANPVINDRSFGEDKYAVARNGIVMMRGLHDAGVLACAKHFPGHGDTDIDSHYDLPRIMHSREHLDEIELYPFKQLIAENVPAIMLAHLEIPALDTTPHLPSSLSHNVATNLLRAELGFTGLIMTDGLGMQGVTKHHQPGHLELTALLAGNDILLCPLDVPGATQLIKQALADGRFTVPDLDARVLRILCAKERAGAHQPLQEFNRAALHTQSAYALKKLLYHQAITVVRDQQHLLPLSTNTPIACITIGGTSSAPFVTTVAHTRACTELHLSTHATAADIAALEQQLAETPTVVIALYDMNKFASKNFGISDATRTIINTLNNDGKKIILTIFGNPYSLPLFADIGTLVVAYEDDPDAQEGAALVVTGQLKVLGTLPVLKHLQQ